METTSDTSITTNNVDLIVPEQLAAQIPNEETTVILQGTPGDDPSNPPSTDTTPNAQLAGNTITPSSGTAATTTAFLPLIKIPQTKLSRTAYFLSGEITGKAITENQISDLREQSIELLAGHILRLIGYGITAYTLKTFSEIELKGNELVINMGKVTVKSKLQQTLISRQLGEPDYSAEILNLLDVNRNKLIVENYDNRKGDIHMEDKDGIKRVIITDRVNYHNGLVVAKQRKMFA